MKGVSKSFRIFIVIAIAALLIFRAASDFLIYTVNGVQGYAEIRNHSSSLDIIAQKAYDLFEKEAKNDSSLGYMYLPTNYVYLPVNENKYLMKDGYDNDASVEFGCSLKERIAILNIRQIFGGKNPRLSSIHVNHEGVFFNSDRGILVHWCPDPSAHREFHAKYANNGYYCRRISDYSSQVFLVFRKIM